MKKNIYMFNQLFTLFGAILIFSTISCQEEQMINSNCQEVNQLTQVSSTSTILDSIFSDKNLFFKSVESDTTIYIINSMSELNTMIENDMELTFDFENETIIGCRILSSSISDYISELSLEECEHEIVYYNLNVKINKCNSCWTALGYLYSWSTYPKLANNKTINLNVSVE